MNKNGLILESAPYILNYDPKALIEQMKKGGGGLVVSGKFQAVDELNQNGRVYPRKVLQREFDKYMSFVKEGNALGELDHPDSSVVALANASHRVIEMRWDGNAIVGSIEIFCDRGEIPGTPSGNILKSLLLNGVKLGISSRGVGSVKEANEGSVVQDDFELIAFDFVSNPSTKGAFMKVGQMNESVQYNTNKYERINSLINKIIYK